MSQFLPMRGLRIASAAIALVLSITPAFGWGSDGHRITAQIAAERLTPTATAAAAALLDGQTLADVSTWADEIRDSAAYAHTKRWHYVNLPRNGPSTYDQSRDCRDDDCVVQQIILLSRAVNDRSASRPQRAEALRFLVHFVGDVHCPVHVAYADDHGGNAVRLSFNGEETNLHQLWDSGLIRANMPRPTHAPGGWPLYARNINKAITDRQAAHWSAQTNPGEWANESFQITRTSVYAFPASRELGREYFDANIQHVDDRLAMGGVRLAAMLNRIFDPRSQPPTPDPRSEPPTPGTNPTAPETSPSAPESPEPVNPDTPDAPDTDPHPVRITTGDPCGNAGGFDLLLINDSEDTFRVHLRKSWTDQRGARTDDTTAVLRPGERGTKKLGCSAMRVRGEMRTFTWEIIEVIRLDDEDDADDKDVESDE